MTKENIYDLIKAHATELVDGRFRFKKVDLKEACAELEDCFKRLHEPVVSGKRLSCQKECGNTQPAPNGLICLNCGSSLKAVCVCGSKPKPKSKKTGESFFEGWDRVIKNIKL